MKPALNLVLIALCSVAPSLVLSAQTPVGINGGPPPYVNDQNTNISTLFGHDPFAQSLCLRDGRPGTVIQNGQVRNRCSELNFNSYMANGFQVAVEGARQGVLIDLGTPEDLRKRYGYSETVGNGQGFASIEIRDGKVVILRDHKTGERQAMAESTELFSNPTSRNSAAAVKVGHIYLLRIIDQHDKNFEVIAKLLVLSHVPNEYVTFRWYLMSNNLVANR